MDALVFIIKYCLTVVSLIRVLKVSIRISRLRLRTLNAALLAFCVWLSRIVQASSQQ